MADIIWGEPIRVDGVRPKWLEASIDIPVQNRLGEWSGPVSYFDGNNAHWAWHNITHIRLPADHPHYATSQPRTAPSGGEVGPEVVGVHDLREARRQDALLWDRMASVIREYATGTDGSVIERADGVARSTFAEARAIAALLPEPVDVDRKAAEIVTSNWLDATPSQNCVELALAAIKRGRALEKGEAATFGIGDAETGTRCRYCDNRIRVGDIKEFHSSGRCA